VPVKIGTVKVHDVIIWFVFVEIRVVRFGVAIANHTYATEQSSFGEYIFVVVGENFEGKFDILRYASKLSYNFSASSDPLSTGPESPL